MADPVLGLEVHDEVSLTLRSFCRCFSLLEGAAWLRRCRHMTAGEALEALAALVELGLVVNLTPGRWAAEPAQCFLQLVPLQGSPPDWTTLVDLVLTADLPLTRKSFLFSETWCFSGAALLDWLVLKGKCKSRSDGTILARRLQNGGLLSRLGRDGLFVDSPSVFFVWKLEGLTESNMNKVN